MFSNHPIFFVTKIPWNFGRGLEAPSKPTRRVDQPMPATVGGELPRAIFLKRRCPWLGGGGQPGGVTESGCGGILSHSPGEFFFFADGFFLGFVFFSIPKKGRNILEYTKMVFKDSCSSLLFFNDLKEKPQKTSSKQLPLDNGGCKKSFLVFTGCALSWWNTLKNDLWLICSGWILV